MGIFLQRDLYTPETKDYAVSLISEMRRIIVLPEQTMKGRRFNDNESVLSRIESAAREEAFKIDPVKFANIALVDAAQSDWWYEYEKDWGSDEREEPEAEDDGEGDE